VFGRLTRAFLALSIVAAPAYAQSLGELARQEEARRAGTTKAAKTLSNADLRPQDITSPSSAPAVESCFISISKGHCVSAEEMVSLSTADVFTKQNAPFEQTWRRDAASLRSRIEGTQSNIETLEAVAMDERRSPGDRKGADRALVTLRQALAGYERQWVKFETDAGTKRIPHAWIEPIPALTKNQPQ
jgi:hypothetical protein